MAVENAENPRIASVGRRGVILLLEDGSCVSATVSGSLMRTEHPVTGDYVILRNTADSSFVVEKFLPRKGCLIRTSPLGKHQIIAANVDEVMVMASLAEPAFVPGIVDRLTVAAEWQDLDVCLVINKIDLADSLPEKEIEIYRNAGYSVFPVSCSTGEGLKKIEQEITGKTVVIAGHSGVGKTSLIKCFNKNLDLRIADVSGKSLRGRHTTVATRLVPLKPGTFLLDTPGVRMFSITHIPISDLAYCFPEFGKYLGSCHFRTCRHVSEPGCAVLEAVKLGEISQERHEMYKKFLGEIAEKIRRKR